jgi:hypothetical protein
MCSAIPLVVRWRSVPARVLGDDVCRLDDLRRPEDHDLEERVLVVEHQAIMDIVLTRATVVPTS